MSDYGSAEGEADAAWNASNTRSLDPARDGQVQTFCSVTGADAETGEHVLEAHNWDLDRSVMFFLDGGAPAQPSTAHLQTVRPDFQAAQAPIAVDDDSPPVPSRHPAMAAPSAPAMNPGYPEMDQDERDLQQALQASLHSHDDALQARENLHQEEDVDDESAALGRMLASHHDNMQHQSRPFDDDTEAPMAGLRQGFLDRGASAAQRQSRQGTGPRTVHDSALEAIGRSIGMPTALPQFFPGPPQNAASQAAVQQPTAGGIGDYMHQPNGSVEMPSDINVEEARMLEAAMLGIPYEGTIPDFAAQAAQPRVPPSASSLAGQSVRQEQDWAYQQSLQADRDKREAEERSAKEKRDAAEAAAQQLADEQAAASAKEANLKQTLQSKAKALPSEPDAGEANVVQVAVRMPGGSRFTRRFKCTDQLAHLFAAIDVHTQGQDLPPGSYRLVAQYPRRVFTDGTPGSLRDVGLAEAKQETVLVETID